MEVKAEELLAHFNECLAADYRHVEQSGDFALVRQGDALFLYFEKSDGLADWVSNFSFAVRPYREMETTWLCHRGFLAVWKAIKPYLELPLADPTVREVTVVGYSHGAAIALLCHEYIWFHRPDLRDHLRGFGFGCPRVLWGFLPAWLSARFQNFIRVVNPRDIVTHLPPAVFGYRHVGQKLALAKTPGLGPIDAHRPENYCQALLKKEEYENVGRRHRRRPGAAGQRN